MPNAPGPGVQIKVERTAAQLSSRFSFVQTEMDLEHHHPTPESETKRLKAELAPLLQLSIETWIVALCKGRRYLDAIVLCSVSKEFNGTRRKAIVKHAFQKIREEAYFPTVMTLYLMRYMGLPVAKQYRKINAKPWDIPERFRLTTWSEPSWTGSGYRDMFHHDMGHDNLKYSFTDPNVTGSHLAGLGFCERQLSSGFSSGGWPQKSRFLGRMLIRTWLHMRDTLLHEFVVRKVEQDTSLMERNLSAHWAYFLSLNRLSHERITLLQHGEFVLLLKKLLRTWGNLRRAASALPPLNSRHIAATLYQVRLDDILDYPGGDIRVLVAHLLDGYISLDIPKDDSSMRKLGETFLQFYKVNFLNGTRYIPMDAQAKELYQRFDQEMKDHKGRLWATFSNTIHITTPLPVWEAPGEFI